MPFKAQKKPLNVDFWQSRDDITKQKTDKSNQKVINMINFIQ